MNETVDKVPYKTRRLANLTGGSRKGVPNKITKQLKEMILGALDDAGGQKYLAQQAGENPAAFMTLIGKVLPTTLANDTENPLTKLPDDALNEQLARLLAKQLDASSAG